MNPLILALSLGLAPQAKPLPQQSVQALQAALVDEWKAEATYRAILKRHGDSRPFSNIVLAEGRHQAALVRLFEAHGLPVPPNPYAVKPPEAPESFQASVQLALQAEVDNVALYDRWLELVQEPDLRCVFENLRQASQERHLPALRRHAGSPAARP